MIEEIHHQENWDEWYSDYHPQGDDREDGINPTFEEWLAIFDFAAESFSAESKFIRPYDGKHGIKLERDNKGRYRRKVSIPLKKRYTHI